MSENIVVKMEKISKLFGPVKALDNVDFELRKGEVHCLLGENGSGKSTLIKVLGGIHNKDNGSIKIDGKDVTIESVEDAEKYGIGIIHQELSFAPMMTVVDNIFMGKEIGNKLGFVNSRAMYNEAKRKLEEFGSDINPGVLMNDLSISQQQVVEIVKALDNNTTIIAMDEPSASLSSKEVNNLYKTVERLKGLGISVIYVSHRMEELFKLGDRVTVLRDGQLIGTVNVKDITEDELVQMMVGRAIEGHYSSHKVGKEILFEAKHVSRGTRVKDVSIEVHAGEVVGISGIVGAGRSEAARIIMGIDKGGTGEVFLNGKKVHITKPSDAIKHGVVLIPENRKVEGLILDESVRDNIVITVLEQFIKFVGGSFKKMEETTDEYVDKLKIKVASTGQAVGRLSGGNQQKVVLSKWLATNPKVMILDEPTRGIDVNAKGEIYHLIDELAKEGMGTIVISSDLPEIIRICDSVYVMTEGVISKKLTGDDINEETIMKYATGGGKDAAS